MSDKEALLKELDGEFANLAASFRGLAEEGLTRVWLGTWGVRELLIHVGGWQREMTAAMERLARGERPTPEGVGYSDADAWNARFVQEAGGQTIAQVFVDLQATYDAYRRAAEALPEDRFAPGRTLDRLLHASGIDHYRVHAAQIQEWRQGQGL